MGRYLVFHKHQACPGTASRIGKHEIDRPRSSQAHPAHVADVLMSSRTVASTRTCLGHAHKRPISSSRQRERSRRWAMPTLKVVFLFHGILELATQHDEVELVRHSLELLPTRPLVGRRLRRLRWGASGWPRRRGGLERRSGLLRDRWHCWRRWDTWS